MRLKTRLSTRGCVYRSVFSTGGRACGRDSVLEGVYMGVTLVLFGMAMDSPSTRECAYGRDSVAKGVFTDVTLVLSSVRIKVTPYWSVCLRR